DGVSTTNRKTSTIKTPISVQLDRLTTWDNIPAVGKGVSGTGHYEADFHWDASKATGAYLDFGDKLQAGMQVWINGQKVGGGGSRRSSSRSSTCRTWRRRRAAAWAARCRRRCL